MYISCSCIIDSYPSSLIKLYFPEKFGLTTLVPGHLFCRIRVIGKGKNYKWLHDPNSNLHWRGRHFVAEEKLIYPGSKLQKWEALKSRFRIQEVWEGKEYWTTALHVRETGNGQLRKCSNRSWGLSFLHFWIMSKTWKITFFMWHYCRVGPLDLSILFGSYHVLVPSREFKTMTTVFLRRF